MSAISESEQDGCDEGELMIPGEPGQSLQVSEVHYSRKQAQANPRRPLFVLLHGWGSNEEDIGDLMRYVAPYNDYVSLRAPLLVPGSDSAMFGPGYSWFHRALPQGQDLDRDAFAAASAIDQWVESHVQDGRDLVLLGFSQGGMLAVHLLRVKPERYRAAICLSGFLAPGLVAGSAPADERLAAMEKPVFYGYGGNDQVVPRYESQALMAWLDEHVWLRSQFYPHMGHEVDMAELVDVRQWLADIDVTSGLM